MKRIEPGILPPLREALSRVFWYKKDLRQHLTACMPELRGLIAQFDWQNEYKRSIVSQLVDTLYTDQHKHFDSLLNLILGTIDLGDLTHLKQLPEEGERKYQEATEALATLRTRTESLKHLRDEQELRRQRLEQQREQAKAGQAFAEQLGKLRTEFQQIVQLPPQPRGYALEAFLNRLFELFDIDSKGSFKIEGEQIDGAFTFQGQEFLLEAKWQDGATPSTDLDVFTAKIGRKLDNTLGLFISMSGFQPTAVSAHSRSRPVMILMDGADLSAVIEGRTQLPDLLERKRKHAARTGEIYLNAFNLA